MLASPHSTAGTTRLGEILQVMRERVLVVCTVCEYADNTTATGLRGCLTRPSTKDPLDAPRSIKNAPKVLSTTSRAWDLLTEGCAITTSFSGSLPEPINDAGKK